MIEAACTEERFLNDVKDHSMEILRDGDLYRHIKFSRGGSSVYRFDLHTWPGELCITGDCGTFVFRRLADMFEFFRCESKEKLSINAGYWGEKLRSVGTNAGYKRHSQERMQESLLFYVEDHWVFDTEEQENQVMQELENYLFSMLCGDESTDYRLAESFTSYFGHQFIDLFEYDFTEYTFGYLWCLYAIVWGIRQYDQAVDSTNCEEALRAQTSKTMEPRG